MSQKLSLFSILLKKCTTACGHCSSGSNPKDKDEFLKTDDVLKILSGFSADTKKKTHIVSGGEPTLHPGVHEILTVSLDLNYTTKIITNAHWVDPTDIAASERYLNRTIPEGVRITTSYDPYHLKGIPSLEKRVTLLQSMVEGRNTFGVDGAYNGAAEHQVLDDFTKRTQIPIADIQVARMGRGKNLEIKTPVLEPDASVYCPKGGIEGFVVHWDGVYYCLWGALNDIDALRISRDYNPDSIRAGMTGFSQIAINKRLRKHHAKTYDRTVYHNNCELCEASLLCKS